MFRRQSVITIHFLFAATLAAVMVLSGSVANAQQSKEAAIDSAQVAGDIAKETQESVRPTMPEAVPVNGFLGVRIGMSVEDVRETLGKLKDKGKNQDLFVFSGEQQAQVYYDDKGKVIALSVDYFGNKSEPPPPDKVLGESLQAKADGSMYQLKRYPEAGYWVAYSRTAGEDPITTVTIQKLRLVQK
jgi:hypothetical protein